jgi:selenide,water dikinase
MAAEMQGKADGHIVAKALDLMCQPQARAADILKQAQAMTDVTGFGLAGHIGNICKSSGTGAVLRIADIPFMEGAAELAQNGVRSSLYPQNKAAFPELPDTPETALLFDPQTAGGLLAVIDAQSAEGTLNALKIAGYQAAIIGETTENPDQIELA